MSDKSVEHQVVEDVKANFPEDVLEIDVQRRGRVSISVKRNIIYDVSLFLRDKLGFDHIASVSGVDHIDEKEFEVIYHAWSIDKKILAALRTRIPRDNPVLKSLIDVWKGALYHERETWEMFGIKFEGHPNLSLFLLPEDWLGIPPLRKDFVLPKRPQE
ncbi:MAG: NADH-quinone oxidoreductase subunit C [Candidatus Methylarchaceae archaeon HK02M1]|nr:NADH-quinone oxidoreductase subunit C [Candidatus Methylarchaceae archaeon HK01M]MCP8312444.1 NADH-quinone oxidoreductase subunit C [Candidatus Methylarchaceae archaeon HK02M1]